MILPEALRATLFWAFSMTHLSMTSVYKFPSIKKLYDTKSSSGISISSCVIDVYSQTIYVLYNLKNGYDLMTYFDYVITDSTVIIYLCQVLYYSNLLTSTKSIFGHLATFALFFFCYNTPAIMSKIILCSTLCSMSGKILQILEINRIVNQANQTEDKKEKKSILDKLANNSQSSWLILIFTSSLKLCIYLFLQLNKVDVKLLFHSCSGLVMNFVVWGMLYRYTPVQEGKKEE
jgi:hypothetical protein